MKKILAPIAIVSLGLTMATSCDSLQQGMKILDESLANQSLNSNAYIASGLKQALTQGVNQRVNNLATTNGFYNNHLIRIGLPSELQKVESTLRSIGLGSLADEGIKALNKTAENAVKEAIPVFTTAITQMTIADATNILMGEKNAATAYLQRTTTQQLYSKFYPIINNSFTKVGADKIWNNLISRYNQVPMVNKVNSDITDYVTTQALNGVFKMIELEEKNIRENISARSTELLKNVFKLQDKK
ncbi:DUF4197 domain-containing protein [Capnocytophaga sp. ARDL2]|uniref:DUF4197 domain-containing protein n=1 Tax=Capnocytophaga sp. ARDL2 TaxID=3238809 RepID=UPI003557D525